MIIFIRAGSYGYRLPFAMPIYNYPVTNKFEARAVTEPEFEPDLFDNGNRLYVDLDPVRGDKWIRTIKFELGIDPDTDLLEFTDDYIKIIFSGHRGCGKTTELKRLHLQFKGPEKYASVFISLEEELELSRFSPEDFYMLLIVKLVEQMEAAQVPAFSNSLKELADQLFNKEEFKQEYRKEFSAELGVDTGGGFDFFGWLKFKTVFKGLLAGKSESARIIRREVKQNNLEIIRQFNLLMADVRQSFREHCLGKDILFIIDGNEKIKREVYQTLFIDDANLINMISANMIIAVRIDAFYDIEKSPVRFSNQFIIPMINLDNPGAVAAMKEILLKRIDGETFITDDALELAIQYSGGCVRQLFLVVNRALSITTGRKIEVTAIEEAAYELGNRMREMLDSVHLEVLRKDRYETGDPAVKALLQSLALLKYNGHTSIRLNPLLRNFI